MKLTFILVGKIKEHFYEEGIKNPNEIVRNALEYAKENKLEY